MFFARATHRSRNIGHRLSIGHSAPALGQRDRLPVCLDVIKNDDPRPRGLGLIEIENVAN